MTDLPLITLELFHAAAVEFAEALAVSPLPDLYGATDGKAVGTKVESMFKEHLAERYDLTVGNAARGIDFPDLNVDLKVTSLKQPQSSSPFDSATQKIYGLGYHLLCVVYVKRDVPEERAAYLDIRHVVFIHSARTGDHTITRLIRDVVLTPDPTGAESRETKIEDVDAILQDKNVPLDEVSRRSLAERIVDDVPEQGVLTISNALQWRLQYGRAIAAATNKTFDREVVDLRA
ncbi:hypothetical protein LY71_1165 [Geodermatophilus tzadiensis]|uniref:Restriction endonuclease n=1 Tax=Geodermatophilus tzadiensis TaxID=1137988 RepID=A0A2T0TF78_9ACTN|nr:restriction endonuclease [Geodermatophilus tzadiensis]PRY44327.1 hypothetical protein LY71_1165 [Geodermatophilus tzadiensis]